MWHTFDRPVIVRTWDQRERFLNLLVRFHMPKPLKFFINKPGLKDGGADVLWLETISSREEFLAAAEAFAKWICHGVAL